jgi:hypothetical protein
MKYKFPRRLTERIWLRCFAPLPKFPERELQIDLTRYTQSRAKCLNIDNNI